MDFIAIDVETANPDMASICQVGIAWYESGALIKEWKSYSNPQDYFDPVNVSIHGIDEKTIKGAPTFLELAQEVFQYTDQQVVICHTHFDRVALLRAYDKYEIKHPECTWLDSARIARHTWEQFSQSGYGLGNVCNYLGYEFNAHDALEDAKAVGHIILSAMKHPDVDSATWVKEFGRNSKSEKYQKKHQKPVKRIGNPYGPLYGERLVFTGALEIPRKEAADLAAVAGCCVDQGVTKKTTILVVGDQDISVLAGHNKSTKHRKVEELITKGKPIRILKESDFKRIIELETNF